MSQSGRQGRGGGTARASSTKLPPISARSSASSANRGSVRGKPSTAYMASNKPKKPPTQSEPIFHENRGEKDNDVVTKKLLQQARKSGQLNLSGRGLVKVPDRVWNIVQLDAEEEKGMQKGLSWDRVDDQPEDNWWDYVPLTKLIIASNTIRHLPPEVGQLGPSLAVLDAHDNLLESLPEEMSQLENLARLNLNHNKLTRLDASFFSMTNLRQLSLANNGLVELSDEIGRLVYLEKLDLSHNEIAELPAALGFATKLKVFDVSKNKLKNLPVEIGSLLELTSLDLSRNGLTSVPDSVATLSKLEMLYLSYNRLNRMPNLRDCAHLKEFFCVANWIKSFSSEDVENLPVTLLVLDLQDNQIADIPKEIVRLQNLERLDVTGNDLSGLPSTLGTLPKLKSLGVDNNPIRTIRRDILKRGAHGLMKYLKERLTEAELTELRAQGNVSPTLSRAETPPVPDKYSMRQAHGLNMSRKELVELPAEAVQNAIEAGVSELDLSRNHFMQFPAVLEEIMPRMKEMNLSFNRIESLPGGLFGQAKSLMYLNMSNNRLSDLPDELSSLPQLRELVLSFNKFSRVPACINKCLKLETLLMNDNQIEELEVKDKLDQLTILSTLDMGNNNIRNVPPELGLMSQLRSVGLEGNLFRVPRRDILNKGTAALLNYLRQRV